MSLLLSFVLAAAPACSSSTDGGTVITCGEARVLVSIAPGAPEEALPRVVDGMTKLYAATETTKSTVTLAKAPTPAIEIALLKSPKERVALGHALVTAVAEKNAKALSRVLVCTWEQGKPLDACRTGFELGLTVANPTPPELALSNTKGTWSGVKLVVPSGCKELEPGAIGCKPASLMWGDRPNDGPLNSQKLLAELAMRQMPPGSTVAEKPCRIGGKAETCSVLSGSAQGQAFTVIIGVGEVQGRRTSFQCIVGGELKGAVPEPCSQLVSMR